MGRKASIPGWREAKSGLLKVSADEAFAEFKRAEATAEEAALDVEELNTLWVV